MKSSGCMNDQIIEAANHVLTTLDPTYHFALATKRLHFSTKYGGRRMIIRADGLWPIFDYGALGLGGTAATAIVQLVRWIRALPRRPIAWWQYNVTHGLGKNVLASFTNPRPTGNLRRSSPHRWHVYWMQ